jgi:hypothetical protein
MGMIDRQDGGPADRARPWIALLLPALAWLLFEYGLGWALRGNCLAVGAWLGPLWGLASLLACAAAWLIAWPIARRGASADPPARPWLARLALLGATVFGLAIGLQTCATLIVPSCAR